MADPVLTPILTALVTKSALPLKAVESQFAIDSSGFSTSRFVRWFNKKWGRIRDNREWIKCHLTCGTFTNIVTAVEISGWEAHDTNYFETLLDRTAQYFDVAEFSADKAYLSRKNLNAVANIGATAFIPFKSNTVPVAEGDASEWARMYHFFMYNQREFMEHYHKRSNVETVFSMMKAKFGDSVKSRSDVGMVNEVLCKVLCHNLAVLIMEMHELGIEPRFR